MELGKNAMPQSLFGLDEAFWFGEESWAIKNTQDGLDDVFLKGDVEVQSGLLGSCQDAESLFDNSWMTTKFDFSSVANGLLEPSINLVTNHSEPLADNVVETIVEFGSTSDSVASQDTVSPAWTSSVESVSESCPTSPEQHVPNIDDIIAWVELNGKLALSESNVCYMAGGMEDDPAIIDQSLVTVEIASGKKMMPAAPQPISTGKTKTPEQKQRKKLQNRNAATRYRCKKRSAQEALNSECAELEGENKMLSKKVESLQEETEYLKKLIVEVFQKHLEQKNEKKRSQIGIVT